MPELPEVEALVRFLTDRSAGSRVERCQLASISALKTFDPTIDALEGTTVVDWRRRGKYLCMSTAAESSVPPASRGHDRPAGPWLVLHLARGGWVVWWDTPPRSAPKLSGRSPLALRVTLDQGRGFDVTEMGTEKRLALWVVRDPAEVEGLATLGPEPLDPSFDRATLEHLLAGEKGTLKNALSRQSLIAGIGNAYSDEILHAAHLSPFKPAAGLDPQELDHLFQALESVLTDAVDRAVGLGAAELKSEKKRSLRVHGRTGQSCPECGDVVREVSFATRSLQYCATCQTGGKPLADRRFSRFVK